MQDGDHYMQRGVCLPEYEFVGGQTMDNVQKMGTMKRNLREGVEVAYEKWI